MRRRWQLHVVGIFTQIFHLLTSATDGDDDVPAETALDRAMKVRHSHTRRRLERTRPPARVMVTQAHD